jgi:hypothetical protein
LERSVSAAGFLANTQQSAIFHAWVLHVPERGLRNAGLWAPRSPNYLGCSFRWEVAPLAFCPWLFTDILGSCDPTTLGVVLEIS